MLTSLCPNQKLSQRKRSLKSQMKRSWKKIARSVFFQCRPKMMGKSIQIRWRRFLTWILWAKLHISGLRSRKMNKLWAHLTSLSSLTMNNMRSLCMGIWPTCSRNKTMLTNLRIISCMTWSKGKQLQNLSLEAHLKMCKNRQDPLESGLIPEKNWSKTIKADLLFHHLLLTWGERASHPLAAMTWEIQVQASTLRARWGWTWRTTRKTTRAW